jgi:glucokinase
MKSDVVAAIDIGGTKIAVALAEEDGTILSMTRFPAHLELGPHRILENAVAVVQEMAAEKSVSISAVGIGCGGPLDRKRGLILSPPNLPGWDEFPIVEIVESKLGVHALLDNDANAAALGELQHGAGRGLKDLVYITISTGIGGGIIVDGKLVHGVGDGAGEVGHIPVLLDGPLCGCGGRGCLEFLCSGTGIARRAKERIAAGAKSSLASDNISDISAKAVAEAAKDGDPLAREVWDETIRYLAFGLNNIIVTLAPEAVILGGGVSTAGDQLLEPLRRQVYETVKILPVEQVRILQAELGGDSALYGAVILGQLALASIRSA